MKRISPAEAQALLEQGFVYLDVRSEGEYAQGHPDGAWNVPWAHASPAGMQPNPDFLKVVQGLFAPDARLVLGCHSGGRSLKAATALEAAGFTQVVDQRAGFGGARSPEGAVVEAGWAEAGLPVEKGQPASRSYADLRTRSQR